MRQVFMICGASGAGKTTHAIALAEHQQAVRFSIDPGMQTLYAADMKELSLHWITDRVARCERQIWQTAPDILRRGVNVVLDLGFMTRAQRDRHRVIARESGAEVVVHYLDMPVDVRR